MEIPAVFPRTVSSAQWTDATRLIIAATIDGVPLHVPDDLANADRRAIAAWVAAGNTIADVPQPTLDEARATRLADLAARRYDAEVGGTSYGGQTFPTDRDTQAKLSAAYTMAKADPTFAVPHWKLGPGLWFSLDNATIIAAGNAVIAHVQACFSREADLSAAIEAAADAAALAAVDINAGWPA